MAMKVRPYQKQCRIALYDWFENQEGNPLVVMATGTGKSICIADFARDVQQSWPSQRIVVAVDVQELIAQNFAKFVAMWPDCSAGVYSAGLGKKQLHHKTLFVGIQSIYKYAFKIQRCDILIVDEAHMIASHSDGMWQTFIRDLKKINPNLKIIGFTATEYRLDSGLLHTGENRMFDGICYRYGIKEAIADGYMCEIIPKGMDTKFDIKGVKKTRGDYNESQLQRAVNVDEITSSAVKEILSYGEKRKSGLIFASGVEHAQAIAEEIRDHGETCEVITGDKKITPDTERTRILNDFINLRVKYVTNNSVLTKGFDHPRLDLIAAMRPTQSPVLWLQMLGRGTRPIYNLDVLTVDTAECRIEAIAAGEKPNCLLLDFAGNTRRFGAMDEIKFKDKGESDGLGVPPMKDCPACATIVFAGVRTCPYCGHIFPEPELKIEAKASNQAVLSTQVVREEKIIQRVQYAHHKGKEGKPDSLRVDYYMSQLEKISEWVFVSHTGYPREKAIRWWKQRHEFGLEPSKDVMTCLDYVKDLKQPTRIWVVPEGKFWRVVNYDFAPLPDQPQQSAEAGAQPLQDNQSELHDHEIPF